MISVNKRNLTKSSTIVSILNDIRPFKFSFNSFKYYLKALCWYTVQDSQKNVVQCDVVPKLKYISTKVFLANDRCILIHLCTKCGQFFSICFKLAMAFLFIVYFNFIYLKNKCFLFFLYKSATVYTEQNRTNFISNVYIVHSFQH